MRWITSLIIVLSLALAQESFAQLRAGVAKAEITPPIGGAMYGYGARGANVSEGVHDALYAKALVLDDGESRLAIVTLDLGSFARENTSNVKEIVKERTGIENVLCIVSHTHSGPRAAPDFPSIEEPWIREAEQRIAGAIVEAAGNLTPARIGVGWGEVREGHNRRMIRADGRTVMFWENRDRIPTSPVDYQLGVIRVEALDGDPLATLVNFACHPVVLGPENLQISADYPGVFMRLVEETIGGQCMFLQGAAGDINPFWDKTPPSEGAFEEVEKMGKAVADEVLRVSRRISDFEAEPKILFGTETIRLASRRDVGRADRNINAEINSILIGSSLALATFPGEFFVEHGLALKRRSRFENTFFIGYCNDALRYFPTIQACTEGGYGAASATIVEVGAGEKLVNRALINLYYLAEMISP